MGAAGSKGCCAGNTDETNNNEMDLQDNNDIQLTKRSENNDKIANALIQNKSISFKDNFPTIGFVENMKSTNILSDSMEYITKVNKLKEIVNSATILKLKIISSSTLPKGTVLSLNAQGLENSFRNKKDGFSYFGCKKKDQKMSHNVLQTEILNDYIIPSQDKEISKRHRGRHFQIEFDIDSKSYRIKDLGIGFGAFYKLDYPLVLKDNHLLNMGLVFIVVNLSFGQSESENDNNLKEIKQNSKNKPFERPVLKLKLFGGPCTGEIQVFEPTDKCITIGRMSDNTIAVDDNLLSKSQCKIEYKENIKGWILTDGKDKPSTNGTWLYLGEQQTIYNGMIFKANQTVFQATII